MKLHWQNNYYLNEKNDMVGLIRGNPTDGFTANDATGEDFVVINQAPCNTINQAKALCEFYFNKLN